MILVQSGIFDVRSWTVAPFDSHMVLIPLTSSQSELSLTRPVSHRYGEQTWHVSYYLKLLNNSKRIILLSNLLPSWWVRMGSEIITVADRWSRTISHSLSRKRLQRGIEKNNWCIQLFSYDTKKARYLNYYFLPILEILIKLVNIRFVAKNFSTVST